MVPPVAAEDHVVVLHCGWDSASSVGSDREIGAGLTVHRRSSSSCRSALGVLRPGHLAWLHMTPRRIIDYRRLARTGQEVEPA